MWEKASFIEKKLKFEKLKLYELSLWEMKHARSLRVDQHKTELMFNFKKAFGQWSDMQLVKVCE